MLKVDHQRWKDLVNTDSHDMNEEETSHFVLELKDAVCEVLKEYETLWGYVSNLENENSLLKTSIKNQEVR